MINQLAASLQYVTAVVTALGGDPTGDPVWLAFTAVSTDPQPGDWKTATWATGASLAPHQYLAQCLVGPGGTVQLPVGKYQTWVKIADNPEIPQIPAGLLTIY